MPTMSSQPSRPIWFQSGNPLYMPPSTPTTRFPDSIRDDRADCAGARAISASPSVALSHTAIASTRRHTFARLKLTTIKTVAADQITAESASENPCAMTVVTIAPVHAAQRCHLLGGSSHATFVMLAARSAKAMPGT